MQPVPYLTRSSFFPAIEAAFNSTGADFEELKVYLGPRGYERDETIEIPGPDAAHLLTSWRGDPGRFSARIRAAATVLHRRGIHGRFRAIHADGLLTLRREWRTHTGGQETHEWRFTGHSITTLIFDPASVRIQSWRPDGRVHVRLGAPFALAAPNGTQTTIDPEEPTTAGVLLGLLTREFQTLTITREGTLSLAIADGWRIAAGPDRRYEAWEAEVGGTEGSERYLCPPAGGSPWG